MTPALRWLDERLAAQGTTADEIVREEHQRQGAMNVTVRNVITSMRLMSAVDWAEFFESVSLVDEVLRAESDFAAMDFPTRDRYRHAIEELARGSGRTEIEVARRALEAAQRAAPSRRRRRRDAAREQDPGYYLISSGRAAFERELGFRAPVRRLVRPRDRGRRDRRLSRDRSRSSPACCSPWRCSAPRERRRRRRTLSCSRCSP